MTVTKTVLGPEVGRGLDLLAGGTEIDQPAYSEGVRLDLPGFTWIMLSGVVALDDDLQVVGDGDLRAQTRFILATIRRKLEEQGSGINDLCRVRVYLVGGLTPERFRIIHEERARIFDPDHYPASTMVEVTSLMKPELLIEIDADAVFSQRDDASNQIESDG